MGRLDGMDRAAPLPQEVALGATRFAEPQQVFGAVTYFRSKAATPSRRKAAALLMFSSVRQTNPFWRQQLVQAGTQANRKGSTGPRIARNYPQNGCAHAGKIVFVFSCLELCFFIVLTFFNVWFLVQDFT